MKSVQKRSKLLVVSAMLAFILVMSACAPLSAVANLPFFESNQSEEAVVPAQEAQVDQLPDSSSNLDVNPVPVAALEGTLGDIYRQVNPSVVNIQVSSRAVTNLTPFGQDNQGVPEVQSALGSGFVWDSEGHIVTNNHVVADASSVEVVFANGASYPAEVIGTDADSDLAVLKIDANAADLQPVVVADSTAIQVGDLAIAIGNPYGLGGTMTVGIISALGRSLQTDNTSLTGSYTIPDIIQTDAAINPGNSGGVLLNASGEVVGVTAAIESPVRANVGIGFVIPSAIVLNVVPELIDNGSYQHSYLGISGGSLVPALAEAMDLDRNQRGVLVSTVTQDGPAEKAGLRGSDKVVKTEGFDVNVGGDIITAIEGNPVRSFDDLVSYLASSTKPGETITLEILRDGKSQNLEVTLEARPSVTGEPQPPTSAFVSGSAYLGISGGSLVPRIAEAMDLSTDQEGVLVVEVAANSPAEESGLQGSTESITIAGQDIKIGGDVIIKIDDTAISGIQDLRQTLNGYAPGDEVTLTILRNGEEMTLQVTLAERP